MPRYHERLWPSAWIFIACLLLIPAALLVALPISVPAGIIAAPLLYAAAVVFLLVTTPQIRVSDTHLVAGRATIELRHLGTATAILGEDAQLARGRELDARAYTLFRGWVPDVVRIEIADPADPAPYWLVSSRRAAELVDALNERA